MPLSTQSTRPEVEYILRDTGAEVVVCADRFYSLLENIGPKLIPYRYLDAQSSATEPHGWTNGDALIVYTSGTTGKPKGVVHTHSSLEASMRSLEEAWQWTSDDKILNVLPMHHMHGIMNILNCSLWAGADCHLHTNRFKAAEVMERLMEEDFSLFMAVPTIYGNLVNYIRE